MNGNKPTNQVHPLFWKVRGKEFYFLGSFHFGPSGGFHHGAAVLSAFDAVEACHFELSQEEMKLVPRLIKREMGSLAEELGPSLYASLCQNEAYDPALEGIKLPFVYLTLAVRPYYQLELSHEHGVEVFFYSRAAQTNKTTQGLETAAEQISRFMSFSTQQIITGLQAMLANPQLNMQMCAAIHKAYVAGDVNAINEVRALINQTPDIGRILLSEREALWMPKIESLLKVNRPTIIIVGALHLAGEQGLIALLGKRGVPIDRVAN